MWSEMKDVETECEEWDNLAHLSVKFMHVSQLVAWPANSLFA